MEQENQSAFIEYFGSSPYIKVLDFLIQGQEFDYGMTEIARGVGVGWSAFTRIWEQLISKKMVIPTRNIENPADCVTFCAGFSNRYSQKQRSLINGNIYIGNAKLFRLNKSNLIVQKIIKIDAEITKIATDEFLHEQTIEA